MNKEEYRKAFLEQRKDESVLRARQFCLDKACEIATNTAIENNSTEKIMEIASDFLRFTYTGEFLKEKVKKK